MQSVSHQQKKTLSETIRDNVVQFGKAQVSAFVGGITDYAIMIILTELFNIHYVYSIIIGGIIGAVVNFSINHFWTFKSDNNEIFNKLFKFLFVVIGSILLKSIGTYLCTEFLSIDYKISRLITDAFVCFGFNYILQKLWVFKK